MCHKVVAAWSGSVIQKQHRSCLWCKPQLFFNKRPVSESCAVRQGAYMHSHPLFDATKTRCPQTAGMRHGTAIGRRQCGHAPKHCLQVVGAFQAFHIISMPWCHHGDLSISSGQMQSNIFRLSHCLGLTYAYKLLFSGLHCVLPPVCSFQASG